VGGAPRRRGGVGGRQARAEAQNEIRARRQPFRGDTNASLLSSESRPYIGDLMGIVGTHEVS